MDNWNKTAACLRAIEEHATWISYECSKIRPHCQRIEWAIKQLIERPEWDTKARDELQQSIEALRLTLALCRSALEAYDHAKIIVHAPAVAAE